MKNSIFAIVKIDINIPDYEINKFCDITENNINVHPIEFITWMLDSQYSAVNRAKRLEDLYIERL